MRNTYCGGQPDSGESCCMAGSMANVQTPKSPAKATRSAIGPFVIFMTVSSPDSTVFYYGARAMQ